MFMCDGIKPLATLIQKKRSANQNAQNSTYLYFFTFAYPLVPLPLIAFLQHLVFVFFFNSFLRPQETFGNPGAFRNPETFTPNETLSHQLIR